MTRDDMIKEATLAIIEKWHPGALAVSVAENGRAIVSPKLYDEAKAAAIAVLDLFDVREE